MALAYILMNRTNIDPWLESQGTSFREILPVNGPNIDVNTQTAITREVPILDEDGNPTGETQTVFDYWEVTKDGSNEPDKWGGANLIPFNPIAEAQIPPNWEAYLFTSNQNKLVQINNSIEQAITDNEIPGDPWLMMALATKFEPDERYNFDATYSAEDRERIDRKMTQLFPDWTPVGENETQEDLVKRVFRYLTHPDFDLPWFKSRDLQVLPAARRRR